MRKKMKTSEKKIRAVAYIRVSTAVQVDRGMSLEAQQERIAQYAKVHDLEIVAVEVDAGLSASSTDRPGLQRALARLDAFEAQALVVAKLDRLSRSIRDMCVLVDTYFKDGQCSLMSVNESIDTGTAGGRMILNVLTCLAQWERESAAERTAEVMQHLKASGRFTGGWPPFGSYVDDEGNLVPHEAEQKIVMLAKTLRATGVSLRRIAEALEQNPRTGKPFNVTQVARMLVNSEAAVEVRQ